MRWVMGVLLFSVSALGMYCPESLIGVTEALNAPTPPSLLQYQPKDETVPNVALNDPSLMISPTGSVKALNEVRRWYGGPPIGFYGRPYQLEGEWFVDFHSLSTHKTGSRLLWRMPYLDFIEGTRLGAPIPTR